MHWLGELWCGASVAHQVFALSLVAATGLFLGRFQIKGIGLGVSGVLFAGLTLAYLGLGADGHVVEFVRDFGLILFVFSIGLQLGPGFFTSLRHEGFRVNAFATLNVVLGVALCIGLLFFLKIPVPAALGVLSGATTNTPSLAAAQQVFGAMPGGDDAVRLQGLCYALAYPFGIAGVIAAMLLARKFRPRGGERAANDVPHTPPVDALSLEVLNPALEGQILAETFSSCKGLTISRICRDGEVSIPKPDTKLARGDILLAVGDSAGLRQARLLAGGIASKDLRMLNGPVLSRRAIVTHREVLGKSLAGLQLRERFGVIVTRLVRHGVEIVPDASMRLQFGDVVMLVGTADSIADAAQRLGDSKKELDHSRVGPLFLGIFLGVIVGMIPIALPGLPAPLRLGLAGGPLIVALVLGRIGTIGKLVFYVPNNATMALREIGIVLFLACVGLKSGSQFFEYLLGGQGLEFVALGAFLTFVPVIVTTIVARVYGRMSVPETCGMLAGAMTDPPALAYAQQVHEGNSTSLAYASVYPLTMLLRILSVQTLALVLM
jgi:putative transport protein